MSSSSFPISAGTVLVADASVVINLNATGRALDIIRAQPGTIVITENAFAELTRGIHHGHDDGDKLQTLIDAGALRVVQLRQAGNDVYASLVEGSAVRTLDDGEAATIGYAHETGSIALIDEKKARTICIGDFPSVQIASTIDLLTHELIESTIGRKGLIDAIVNALLYARMRVPPDQIDMVVKLIGNEAAEKCHSLPKAARAACYVSS